MANPDIVGVQQILGVTVTKNLAATLTDVIGAVPTGDVYKVNSIMCCNVHTADVTVDIKIDRGAGYTSDNDVFLVKGLTIPVGATLDVLNKPIYLLESDKLAANSTATSYVDMTVSYEDIS